MPIQVDITKTFLYKEGEKRGIQEGLKEAIVMVVQVKFGQSKSKQVKKLLEKIDDIKQLKKIKREVLMAKRWDDFIKAIMNSQKSKLFRD